MLPIQTALLFTAPLHLDLKANSEALISHLKAAGYEADEICPAPGDAVRFRLEGLSISIVLENRAVESKTYKDALNSPLTRRSEKTLTEILKSHQNHILITLDRIPGTLAGDPLRQLSIAHCAASFIAKQSNPQAVHWRQSNLMLSGKQFRSLADQKTPWALFARLKATGTPAQGDEMPKRGVEITNACDFIGAPVQLEPTDSISLDAACAGALAFLRHAVQSDIPISDGQTFGPHPDLLFRLDILKPSDGHCSGTYQLSVASGQTETVLDVPARPSGTTLGTQTDANDAAALGKTELAPLVGTVPLVTNLIFGVNATRTGLLAVVTVAVGLVIGAYSFLNTGAENSAILANPETIQATPLGK